MAGESRLLEGKVNSIIKVGNFLNSVHSLKGGSLLPLQVRRGLSGAIKNLIHSGLEYSALPSGRGRKGKTWAEMIATGGTAVMSSQ